MTLRFWKARQSLLKSGHLTQKQAENLTYHANSAIADPSVHELVITGKLPIVILLELTIPASEALLNAGVRALMNEGILTISHIAAIKDYPQTDALLDTDIQHKLRNGQMTIEQIILPTQITVDHPAASIFRRLANPKTAQEFKTFTRLISQIKEKGIELPDLSVFQKQIQNSEGYHQFCSQMLRQSAMFFSHKTSDEPSAECVNEHRNNR